MATKYPWGGARWNRGKDDNPLHGLCSALLEERPSARLVEAAERVRRLHLGETIPAPPWLHFAHGWATRQVVDLVREHGEPLAPVAIRRAIRDRFGVDLNKSTITAALCASQDAKAGRIVRLSRARYVYVP